MLKEEIEQVRGMIQAAVGVAKAELRADFESKLDDLKDELAKLKTSNQTSGTCKATITYVPITPGEAV